VSARRAPSTSPFNPLATSGECVARRGDMRVFLPSKVRSRSNRRRQCRSGETRFSGTRRWDPPLPPGKRERWSGRSSGCGSDHELSSE
jgi:hypothetical protein